MAVWLVTGGNGFVGRQVLEALSGGSESGTRFGSDAEVVALGRKRPAFGPHHRFIEADLNDLERLRDALRGEQPDYVIHTAGRTPPAADDELYRANFWATVHLLGTLRSLGKPMRIVLTGSAAELGPVAADRLPVGEDYAADPVEAYGRSKLMATRSGLAERPPLEVVAARVFNVIGPGLPPTQAFGAFASRLAEPGPDRLDLPVGPLDTRRDFVDVRDVARAMIALALRGRSSQVYHVGTGCSRSVREGLDYLVDWSGRSVAVRLDPALVRRHEIPDSRADIGRIEADTGWRPSISFEATLRDLWAEAQSRQPANLWRTPALQASERSERPTWRLPLTA
ncbi:MAG: NAD-dependent epimerase/dehydratase family protein [Isosphaeraceae bacterium]